MQRLTLVTFVNLACHENNLYKTFWKKTSLLSRFVLVYLKHFFGNGSFNVKWSVEKIDFNRIQFPQCSSWILCNKKGKELWHDYFSYYLIDICNWNLLRRNWVAIQVNVLTPIMTNSRINNIDGIQVIFRPPKFVL